MDYFQAYRDYENMYAQCSMYLQMAEATDGYREFMPIYIIGTAADSVNSSRAATLLDSPNKHYAFMVFFLGVKMEYGIAGDIDIAAAAFAQTDTYQQMPVYPHEGCSVVVDGSLYLKLSD